MCFAAQTSSRNHKQATPPENPKASAHINSDADSDNCGSNFGGVDREPDDNYRGNRTLFREFFDQVVALHHVTESKRHSPQTRFM